MRGLTALAAAAVVAVLAGPAEARLARGCALPPHARTVARSNRAIVYAVDRFDPYGEGETTFTACVRRTGERQVVYVDAHFGEANEESSHFRLAGDFVAWSHTFVDHYGGERAYVDVWDLRRGRIARGAVAGGREPEQFGPGTWVSALELTSYGAVAWVTETYDYLYAGDYGSRPPGRPRPRRRLGSVDMFGQLWLDEGLDIDPESLRVTHGYASWRKSGVTRSAPLQTGEHCALGRRGAYERRNRFGVVYRYDTGRRHHRTRHWYGCLFRSGRRTHLAEERRNRGLRAFKPRISGRFAAIVVRATDEARDAQRVRVRVFDLLAGTRKWSSTVGTNRGGEHTRFGVPELVLARNGAIAYIATKSRVDRPHADWELSVRARWPGGSGTVDSGPGIVWYILRLEGLTAIWLHGDEERSLDLG
jgi:hypothetical protein